MAARYQTSWRAYWPRMLSVADRKVEFKLFANLGPASSSGGRATTQSRHSVSALTPLPPLASLMAGGLGMLILWPKRETHSIDEQ
jgi:hypothetical protein